MYVVCAHCMALKHQDLYELATKEKANMVDEVRVGEM